MSSAEIRNFDEKSENYSLCQVRPNILASLKDERELVIIRDVAEIDKSPTYSMVTPVPYVEMEYGIWNEGELWGQYCPKFKMVLYIEVRNRLGTDLCVGKAFPVYIITHGRLSLSLSLSLSFPSFLKCFGFISICLTLRQMYSPIYYPNF